MTAKKTHAQYVKELAAIGKVEALEEYKHSKAPILHRCLRCGTEQMRAPMGLVKGQGLRCCMYETTSNRQHDLEVRSARYRDSYPQRLATIGKVVALEEYIEAKIPILHRCLKHGEVHMAYPSNMLSGCGMKCCVHAGAQEANARKKKEAKDSYAAQLKAIGRVEALEDYIDAHTPILHRCLKHGVVQKAQPSRMKRKGGGNGLSCCKEGGDCLKRFSTNEKWADSPCHLYVAQINGAYLKPGIAVDLDQRVKNGAGFYSGYAFISPTLTRAEAWAIEQHLLNGSTDARPDELPKIYMKWGGRTELRDKSIYPESWYISRFWELLEQMGEEGWEAMAEQL